MAQADGTGGCSRRAFFDKAAADWDSGHRFDPARLDRLVAEVGVAEGETVLDLGTGTGVLVPHLLSAIGAAGSVIAVDYSGEMLARAKARFPDPRVTYVQAEAADITLADGSVDKVICFSAFPHFPAKGAAMAEAARLLRPGGSFHVAHFDSRADLNDMHAKVGGAVGMDHLPPADAMRSLAAAAGLRVTVLEDAPGRYLFATVKPKE